MSENPCLPPITDHAFMRLVKKRCEDMSRSMAEIAAELGCDVDDLCRWIMAYREPRVRPAKNNSKYGPPIRTAEFGHGAAAFKAWKRQHDGVKATRAPV